MTYSYINVNEGIGTSVITLVKGMFQLGASIIDTSLNPSYGLTELAAVGIIFVVLAWMVKSGRSVKDNLAAAF
jgi:hypothetical protein